MPCENTNSKGVKFVDNRSIEELYSTYFPEPIITADIYTPTNITGMYRKLISQYLEQTEYSKTKVLPAINKEQDIDHGNTFIVIKRGSLTKSELGIKGWNIKGVTLPEGMDATDISILDSESWKHLQELGIECTLYGENLAEIEKIGYIVYRLILAYSNDILSKYTPGIKNVSAISLSEAVPSKKHTNRFECYINFNVTFFDKTILLMAKNMIKYLNITVSEKSSVNTIALDGDF